MVFPVVMYRCESRTIKKAERQRIDAFKLWCWRRLCKEIKPVNPKGNQPWIFTGRTDAEAEAPVFWPHDIKSWFTGKDPDAGKDWRQEEKGVTEDEMVGWSHCLNGHEFVQALGDGEGQGSLHAAFHEITKSRTRLSDWTTTKANESKENFFVHCYFPAPWTVPGIY